VLLVSISGYHEHLARRVDISKRRHLSDEALLVHIGAVYAENRGAYGWPRISTPASTNRLPGTPDLAATAGAGHSRRQAGVPTDRSSSLGWKLRVQRLMQKHGIQARGKRRFRVATTDSRHNLPIAPNLLDRNFTVAAPNQAWVGDFTYIATEEGWLFLAVVIDLFSRKVVGWSMRPDMRRNLVIDALEMAWFQRRAQGITGLTFHSDSGSQYRGPHGQFFVRGVEYASEDFSEVLKEHGITPSMSRKGNCWDNACSETLFGSLKMEWLHCKRFVTIREAKDEVLEWLRWYNRNRMHSTLDYFSPDEYEQRWKQQQLEAAV
jgi:putative transposase